MTSHPFDYEQYKTKLKEYEQICKELIPAIQNHWKQKTGLTITEIIPTLTDYFSKINQPFYMIQSRYILTSNPLHSIWEEQTYHLSIEYYAHPTTLYLLLPNHIIWGNKICNYEAQHDVCLTPMDMDQLIQKEKQDQMFEREKANGTLIWIATEERDLTFDELQRKENWTSQTIALENRNINKELVAPIIQYINDRENGTLKPTITMSKQKTEQLLNEFFQTEKTYK